MKRTLVVALLVSSIFFTQLPRGSARQKSFDKQAAPRAQTSGQAEPNAGSWRTWVITSATDYRVPPPPNPAETQAELRWLAICLSSLQESADQSD